MSFYYLIQETQIDLSFTLCLALGYKTKYNGPWPQGAYVLQVSNCKDNCQEKMLINQEKNYDQNKHRAPCEPKEGLLNQTSKVL